MERAQNETVDPAAVIQSLIQRHARLYAELSQECAMLDAAVIQLRRERDALQVTLIQVQSDQSHLPDSPTSPDAESATPPAGD